MFLETNHTRLANFIPADLSEFTKNVYIDYDALIKKITLRLIYMSHEKIGCDLCVFCPPELLASACILLGTIFFYKEKTISGISKLDFIKNEYNLEGLLETNNSNYLQSDFIFSNEF